MTVITTRHLNHRRPKYLKTPRGADQRPLRRRLSQTTMEGVETLVHLLPLHNDAIQRKASDLLATNPEIRNIILRARSSGKLRKAVHDCVGDPKSFGRFWDDATKGPILNELVGCI
jgi:hypothetical protein